MKSGIIFTLAAALLLSACGYKGDLYLPKENDKARFGVIQTGLHLNRGAHEPTNQTTE